MSTRWTKEEFLAKADHEGGLASLWRWGLRDSAEAPIEIADLWWHYGQYMTSLHDLETRIQEKLNG